MLGLPSASDREVRKSSDLDKAPVTVEQRHSRRHSIDLVSASTFVPPFATMPASRTAGRWGPFDGCPNRHLTTNRGVEAALRQPPGGTIFKSPSTGDLAASWRPYRRNARFRCQFVQDSASKMRALSSPPSWRSDLDLTQSISAVWIASAFSTRTRLRVPIKRSCAAFGDRMKSAHNFL
jgi:hypothetical protein